MAAPLPSCASKVCALRSLIARPRLSHGWHAKGLLAMLTLAVAWFTLKELLSKVGHPGAALDDSFIHFQYARAIAEGHPFRYQAGEPISTGATSLLWPILLAPFYLVGFRELAILWPAWALSYLSLGLLARETYRLARPLSGEAAAICAGAMVLAFGGFVWCAASGMEVVPFAWTITRTVHLTAEWLEGKRNRRVLWELTAFAWASFLLRPEGAIFAACAAAAMVGRPRVGNVRERLQGLLPLAIPIAVPLLLRAMSGSAMSTTAQVKLLAGNPYYPTPALFDAIQYNVQVFFGKLLNGRAWAGADFVPGGGGIIALAGIGAALALGVLNGARWRAVLVVIFALSILVPCTYLTFLWNRLRYLWPFAPGWFVGLACLARLVGDSLAVLRPRLRVVTPIMGGIIVGLLGARMEGVIADVVSSASGIDRQQVALGRWAKTALPAGARVGLNDTGAIAYLSDKKTFDVVGLTTPGEGRYWVAGAGSRFEHYERLAKSDPARLPTHFIVYPEWLGCDALLGEMLTEAVVTDSTILGGAAMRAFVADYSSLGSGDRPWTPLAGDLLDHVDVADLESEHEHAYELAGAHDGENVARNGHAPDGRVVVDGGRTHRHVERFVAHLQPKTYTRVIVRLESRANATLHVRASGRELPAIEVQPSDEGWTEITFELGEDSTSEATPVEITSDALVSVYGYWFFTRSG